MNGRVLVAYASKMGSTKEIAEMIGMELRLHGIDVTVAPASKVSSVRPYEFVILGSAIYVGKWMKPAETFLRDRGEELSVRPVWLFSSGPVGDPPKPEDAEPEGIGEAAAEIGARGHEVFAGRLDYEAIGRVERLMVKALKAPQGDFRDWDAIRGWARSIAAELAGA